MADNNFLIFDENNTTAMSQANYSASSVRINGITAGLAERTLYDKLFRQTSIMASVVGEVIKERGVTASDSSFASLLASFRDIVSSSNKVISPVADLTALRAINTSLIADSSMIVCKTTGIYRFDTASALADNANTVIAPTIGGGRWIKLSVNYFGANTFTGDQDIVDGDLGIKSTTGTANKRWMKFKYYTEYLQLNAINDAGAIVRGLIRFFHDGLIQVLAKLQVDGGLDVTGTQTNNDNLMNHRGVSSGTVNKRWYGWSIQGSTRLLAAYNDVGVWVRNILQVNHDGGMGLFGTLKAYTLSLAAGALKTQMRLADYSYDSGAVTGTMKITLPVGVLSSMSAYTVEGYSYDSKGAWSALIGGYAYQVGPAWVNYSAILMGDTPFTRVRFAMESGVPVILLGDLTTVWQYPKISLDKILSGFSGWDIPDTGFSISLITSEAGLSIQGSASKRLSMDMGWKYITINTINWFSGTAGYNVEGASFYCLIADPDFVVGDVVTFEVGYGSYYDDYNVATRAGMVNTALSNAAGQFHFFAASVPSGPIRLRYKIER